MDLEQARSMIESYIREQFGKVVELREIVVTRSATGRLWNGMPPPWGHSSAASI